MGNDNYMTLLIKPFFKIGEISRDMDDNYVYAFTRASFYQINIDSIDYNGPGVVLKDNSKWSVKPDSFDCETYGFEIKPPR